MAQPTVLKGTQLLLKVGDGASPEVFAEPCGLTTKSFDRSAATSTNLIPDCADPEAPAWESTDVSALSCTFSGSGLMARESFDIWNDWFESAEGKNMQIWLGTMGHFNGNFVLTSFKLSGQRGNKVQVEVAAKADGAVAWVEAP
ncbi:phage tail tube protein [Rhodopseudomonas telluris]|uniref:Phage tail tube protein n=1 Tax=Rhodopseudomonas telluris TaxID=644215 RepID=A0ABV6EZK7_9BRAD